MAVAFDAVAIPTYALATVTFSWTHTPVGTPSGVAVIVVQEGSTDQVSGVTYGGVAMTRVRSDVRTATEAGRVYIYFLGSGVPAAAQMVEVTLTGTLDTNAVSLTVTATSDTSVDVSAGADAGIIANPSLAISPTVAAVIFYGIFTGLAAPVTTVQTGSTHVAGKDYGTDSAMWARKSVASGGATTIGYTAASDDVCHAALAIKEYSTPIYEYGVAALSGLGTLAGIGVRTRRGLATLVGVGTILAAGKMVRAAKSTLAGVGLVAAIGRRVRYGIATLVGAGSLSGIWTRVRTGITSFDGVGSVSAIGTVILGAIYEYGSALLSGVGSLVATGVRVFTGETTLIGVGTLSGIGVRIRTGFVTLIGAGTVSAIGTVTGIIYELGSILLTGIGTLVGRATMSFAGKVALAGVGNISAVGKKKLVAPPGREVKSYDPTVSGEIWW